MSCLPSPFRKSGNHQFQRRSERKMHLFWRLPQMSTLNDIRRNWEDEKRRNIRRNCNSQVAERDCNSSCEKKEWKGKIEEEVPILWTVHDSSNWILLRFKFAFCCEIIPILQHYGVKSLSYWQGESWKKVSAKYGFTLWSALRGLNIFCHGPAQRILQV